MSDDDVALVPAVYPAAEPANVPLGGGVEDDVVLPRRSARIAAGVPPERLCYEIWV